MKKSEFFRKMDGSDERGRFDGRKSTRDLHRRLCIAAQVFVQSYKGCGNEKTKKRMAVLTTIRFLTMGYHQSISRAAFRVARTGVTS